MADAINGDSWNLPHPRSDQEVDLHSHLTTFTLPLPLDIADDYIWVAGDAPVHVFSSSSTWETLRPRQGIKDWCDVVWFKGAVPKQAFTMWIANYDRLPTRARLASWGLPLAPTCALCTREVETRDHLMFSCDYSRQIWSEVFGRCRHPPSMLTDWSELLS